MGNSLNRDLIAGEEVIIKAECLKPEFAAIQDRVFIVNGNGFGSSAHTSGTALYGRFADEPEGSTTRLGGYDIDAQETEQWQKDHPKSTP